MTKEETMNDKYFIIYNPQLEIHRTILNVKNFKKIGGRIEIIDNDNITYSYFTSNYVTNCGKDIEIIEGKKKEDSGLIRETNEKIPKKKPLSYADKHIFGRTEKISL